MRQPKSEAVGPTEITLATHWPAWKVANDRLRVLCEREDEVLHELGVLNLMLGSDAPLAPPPVGKPLPPKPVGSAALGLLDGIELPPAPAVVEPEPNVFLDERFEARRQLVAELEATREAIELLRPIEAREKRLGSQSLCEHLRPEYAALMQRVTKAAIELGEAALAHENFMAMHVSADRGYLRPPALDLIVDDPRDKESRIRQFLVQAAEGGYFDLSMLPQSWHVAKPLDPSPVKVRRGVVSEAIARLGAMRKPRKARKPDVEVEAGIEVD